MTDSAAPHHNVKQAVPFFCVADMERSLRYYVDGLGFTMTNKWVVNGEIRWCWLQLGGAALMLQNCAKKMLNEMPPGGKLGQGVSIWFQCEDAISIYRDVKSRGIQASEPQVGNGLWDMMLSDPDGYRLHFESPTDVPEETKLSEVQF